jgi:C-terminal processing protease CtpA/Prc
MVVKRLGLLAALLMMITACTPPPAPDPTPTEEAGPTAEEAAPTEEDADPTTEEAEPPTEEDADPTPDEAAPPAEGAEAPVQLVGEVEVSNALILEVYFNQRFVYLQDLTGFVTRDFEYEQPLEGQVLGPVITDEGAGTFSYVLNLPAQPVTPLNDVDNDGDEDAGVAVWQVVMDSNLYEDPFLKEDETGGWSTVYTSAVIDPENENEIAGGKVVIWAPDDEQSFPSGFGEDGLLFTEDDPTEPVPAGYSVIDLDEEPFTVEREAMPEIVLREGDIQVNDFSDLGWSEAFDALWEQASTEYPFTDIKDGLDWDALYEEFAPRIAEAEENNDGQAYYAALQEFAWAIPDGHVGLSGNDFGAFQGSIGGSYGFTLHQLTDGRVVVGYVEPESAAAEAGLAFGTEITAWDGTPIEEALTQIVPFSAPFSNPESERVQELRYLVRDPLGTEAEVTFLTAGGAEQTATLEATDDAFDTFTRTSVFAGFDPNALPIEYEILDSGYGYVKINSLSDDLFLTIRLWEIAVETFIGAQVPGIVIDLRQNGGGAPIGTLFASYFYEGDPIDIGNTYYYSEATEQFATFGPPDQLEAVDDPDLYYDGQIAVLVSSACSSACEDVAYTLNLLDQTRVFGYTSTNGIFGEVARGQYLLPPPSAGGQPYSFQIPTGFSQSPEGEILIEGPGVVPDVRVPLTEETLEADIINDEDVVLDFAVETLDQPIGAGVEPSGPPSLSTESDVVTLLTDGTPFLEDLARESYGDEISRSPGETFVYTVALNQSREVIWGYFWCAADEATLDQNFQRITLAFTLNGEEVSQEENFTSEDLPVEVGVCRVIWTLVSDIPPGEHNLQTSITFTAPIDDGIEEEPFAPGTTIYEYQVFVAR